MGTALGSYDRRRGYIQKLVVEKRLRHRGIGKQLVRKVMKGLQSVGATYIPIAVEEALVPFYKSCGFKVSGQTAMNINI